MISIQVRFLGGLHQGRQATMTSLDLSDGTTVGELEVRLKDLGIDPDSPEIIISLAGRGLRQYPAGRTLQSGDELIVFPNISGG